MGEQEARGISRRRFLQGTAAASLGTAATAVGIRPAAAEPIAEVSIEPHGAELRGLELVLESPTAEGRFGYMFKNQPPHAASEDLLSALGQTMEERPVIGTNLTDPETGEPVLKSDGSPVVVTKDHNDALGENPSPVLTSGFTFVGQFVDHDITFDTTTLSEQQSDPNATTNFRTPRYDLDAVYGRGPSKDPQLYDPDDRDKFLIVKRPYSEIRDVPTTPDVVYDVPRDASGKAIMADPRNDQTLILLQLHVALQMFHNKLVDHVREEPGVRAVPRAVGVRVGPTPGPVALPVDGDPRLPARNRGQGHGRLGVQGGPDRASDHQPQVLPDDQPAGPSLHPGGVLGSRVPLRPQHRAAPIHGAGFHRYPDRRHRGRSRASRSSRPSRPTTT